MGITFRHDVASLAGAFGGTSGQSRGRKYARDMLAQQARQPKPILLEQPEGQWVDPLSADNPFFAGMSEQEQLAQRRQQKAQLRTAERKYRMGKPYQGNLLPQFQPQAEIDAFQKRGMEAAAQQQELADDEWEFHLKGIDRQIPAIPEHLAGTEWESDLKKINEAERKARGDRSLSDDQREEAIARIQEQRETMLKGAPPATTPMEEWNKGLRYMGPDGRVQSERGEGEGWTPGHMRNGEFVETPQNIAQREQKKADAAAQAKAAQDAAAAQAKAEAERQKARDAIQDGIDKLDDEIAELEDDEEKEHPKTIAAKRARRETLTKKLGEIASGAPSPTAPPAVGLLTPDGARPAKPVFPTELTPEDEYDLFGIQPPEMAANRNATVMPPAPVSSPESPSILANRNAPASAPALPATARGGQQFGQPIKNYKPVNDAERNLMTKGYARVPILNAKGRQTGRYSWTPPGTQSPDMLANRNVPVSAPQPPSSVDEIVLPIGPSPDVVANRLAPANPPAPPTEQPVPLVPGPDGRLVQAAPISQQSAAPAREPTSRLNPPKKAVQGAVSAVPAAKAQQYGLVPNVPPEVVSEVEWLNNLLRTKGGPASWSAEERARYQQNRQNLARYSASNQ